MQQQSQCRRAAIIEEKIQSSLLLGINTSKRKRGARNSQRTTNSIYIRGGCHLQGNLVNTNGVFPRMEWGTRSAETPCRLKRDSWQGVFTIASFADMTIPTFTQRPVTGAIIPGSTILNGVEGTLGFDVRWGWGMGQRSQARSWLTSNGAGCGSCINSGSSETSWLENRLQHPYWMPCHNSTKLV